MRESLIVIRGPIGAGKSSVSQATHDLIADHASIVETDAIKRMIDPNESSDWRRDIAHSSAAFIVEQVLKVPRTGIVEVHTKYPRELDRLADIAQRCGAPMLNILLTAPLEICKERAASRQTPELGYAIDHTMVEDYYRHTEPRPSDLVFDTAAMLPNQIAASIIENLAATSHTSPSQNSSSLV